VEDSKPSASARDASNGLGTQITKVIEELSKQLKDKEHQMQEFQIKYSVRPENMGAPPAGGNA
jgi:hypothetical protein